ncbi:MAG: MetQ/NlpA family ABC transporter substrate-binding protein [Actinomycetaceae bacterium]|nr:MetQ/NlpA family ABC transporter substrate-binding protein [Actinomycetaceae bacterium]
MRKTRLFAAAAAATALVLAGCSSSGGTDSEATDGANTDADGVITVTVGASPSPHARMLRFIDEELAADAGIKLDIVEYTDYILPNEALKNGDLDANFYQTVPYLEGQEAELGVDFTGGAPVHIEPLGVYSEKITDIADLPDGATIGIISDTQNQGRALQLLASGGLVKLPEGEDPTIFNVEKLGDFEFVEVEGAQLVRALPDVDIAVINGNYAQEGGLSVADDALLVEEAEGNPAANILAWRAEDDANEGVQKLEELLHSPEVKQFIEETWTDGSVLPAF